MDEDLEEHGHHIHSKWSKAGGAALKSEAGLVAKRMREAAKLKELQRQPFPMVLARIKHLLDRIHKAKSMLASSRSSTPIKNQRGTTRDDIPPSEVYRRLGGTSPEPILPHPHFSSDNSRTHQPHPHFRPDSTTPEPESMYRAFADEGDHLKGAMRSGPSSPSIHTLDEMVEELNVMFTFVSDFLRRLPDAVRSSLAFHARIENYKKDQDVYMIGDEPDKFFVILAGQVEVWTHPPGKKRHKTHLDTLRKGHSFGDLALLNSEPRSECCTPSCNCTFLTLDRRTFLNVLGPYYESKLEADVAFFKSNSEIFSTISSEETKNVINKMMISTYRSGKEWEPMQEQQIFFIKSGQCVLESHDHKSATQTVTRSMLGGIGGDAPALADEGTLANVVIGQDGRAIGTLGHEEEIKRLRRMLIPKKVLTILGPGSVFGGGPVVMGEGDAQATLKVLAQTDVEVFHMHVGLFVQYASESDLLRVLRDDFSFKLTYYLGRKGEIAPNQVIGHEEALLQCTAKDLYSEERNPALAAALASNPAAGLRNLSLHSPGNKGKKKVVKHVHEPGKFSPEVVKALAHIQALKDGHFAGDADMQKHYAQIEKQGVTPSETFWSSPHANATNRSMIIPPLLNQIFPEGLKPLGDKVEELVVRTARKTEEMLAAHSSVAFSSPSKRFNEPPQASETAGIENAAQRLERMLRLSQVTTSAPSSPTGPVKQDDEVVKGSISRSRLSVAVPASHFSEISTFDPNRHHQSSGADGLRFGRSRTSENHPSAGSGGSPKGARATSSRTRGLALTAAGVIWEKQHANAGIPLQRQCLTFDEMGALKKKAEAEAAREAEAAKRSAMMVSLANPSLPATRKGSIAVPSSMGPSRMSSFTRSPSVRTINPMKRYEPEVSRLSAIASYNIPPHLQAFGAEASQASDLGA